MIFTCPYCDELLLVKGDTVISCQCEESVNAEISKKESKKQWNLERGNKLNEYRRGRSKRSSYRK